PWVPVVEDAGHPRHPCRDQVLQLHSPSLALPHRPPVVGGSRDGAGALPPVVEEGAVQPSRNHPSRDVPGGVVSRQASGRLPQPPTPPLVEEGGPIPPRVEDGAPRPSRAPVTTRGLVTALARLLDRRHPVVEEVALRPAPNAPPRRIPTREG